jgi:hypothetical protein
MKVPVLICVAAVALLLVPPANAQSPTPEAGAPPPPPPPIPPSTPMSNFTKNLISSFPGAIPLSAIPNLPKGSVYIPGPSIYGEISPGGRVLRPSKFGRDAIATSWWRFNIRRFESVGRHKRYPKLPNWQDHPGR